MAVAMVEKTLLERMLEASPTPLTSEDVVHYVRLYGSAVRVVTPTAVLAGEEAIEYLLTANGPDDAEAILTAPVPGMGEMVCGVLGFAIGADVNGKVFQRRVLTVAKAWGAQAVIGAYHRNPQAFVRKYGGEIVSTNIRFEV